MKYAASTKAKNVNKQYFTELKTELESFASKDLSGIVTVSTCRNKIKDNYWIRC
jgi:hypothetical protein